MPFEKLPKNMAGASCRAASSCVFQLFRQASPVSTRAAEVLLCGGPVCLSVFANDKLGDR